MRIGERQICLMQVVFVINRRSITNSFSLHMVLPVNAFFIIITSFIVCCVLYVIWLFPKNIITYMINNSLSQAIYALHPPIEP